MHFSILVLHFSDMLALLGAKHLTHFIDLSIHEFDQLLVTCVHNSLLHVVKVELLCQYRTLRGRYLSTPRLQLLCGGWLNATSCIRSCCEVENPVL